MKTILKVKKFAPRSLQSAIKVPMNISGFLIQMAFQTRLVFDSKEIKAENNINFFHVNQSSRNVYDYEIFCEKHNI